MVNSLAATWLANSLEKNLQPSVACIENAKTIWDDLRHQFSHGNVTRIYQTRSEIYSLSEEGRSVSEYYSLLKGLWDERDNLLEATTCVFAALARRGQHNDREKAHELLMGLNSDFSTNWTHKEARVTNYMEDHLLLHLTIRSRLLGRIVQMVGTRLGRQNRGGRKQRTHWSDQAHLAAQNMSPVQTVSGPLGQTAALPFFEAQIQQIHRLSMSGLDDEAKTQTGNILNFVNCESDWIVDPGASRHMTGCYKPRTI
ncbi:hypothetical protein CRG98_036245 [Punica granatum]|uniref:Retrotransposon gag domain-containing protein n=1 Tax=Punica granatum TaxID=22663 RepID=A0A2I0IH65_PUNGR|nr:hypothetical protein CRG98_036245 [Punica granatum]